MTYDVIVAGGGVAGIAAALSARRAGAARVLILERQYLLGGLATCGLVTIYLPLCDGTGRQVSFSIAEELLRLSVRHGAEGRYPAAWLEGGTPEERGRQRYQVQFNPYVFAIEAENLLLNEGAELLYGAMVCGATAKNGRMTAVEIVHKSGRETLDGRAFVDATGDADLFWLAGADTALFRQGNLLAAWYFQTKDGANSLQPLGVCDTPEEYKTPEEIERGRSQKRYVGLDARELSQMTVDAHKALYDDFLAHGSVTPGHSLTAVAAIPQLRMTRRLCGLVELDDKRPYAREEASIGMAADWRKRGAAYELPLGMIQSAQLANVFAAGRCVSVTDSMWDITRAIPACAVTGQAAGAAAALISGTGLIDTRDVRKELQRQGAVLHFTDERETRLPENHHEG